MSRTITTTVFTFNELTDAAKETARDWYRTGQDIDLDGALDMVKGMLSQLGWDVDTVEYSLGYSQSDHAGVVGTWRKADVNVTDDWGTNDTFANLKAAVYEMGQSCDYLTTRSTGNYGPRLHEVSHIDADDTDTDVTATEHDNVNGAFLRIGRVIYEALRADYEWSTADEQVDDSILANEYTFTAEGKRFG